MIILALFILRFSLISVLMFGDVFTDKYSKVLKDSNKKNEMMMKTFTYPTLLLLNIKEYGYSDRYIKLESSRGKERLRRDKAFIMDKLK